MMGLVLLVGCILVLCLLSLLSPEGLDAGYGPYDEATEAFGFTFSCFLLLILVCFLVFVTVAIWPR
jgi:H+/Cl- antiporter ClcA